MCDKFRLGDGSSREMLQMSQNHTIGAKHAENSVMFKTGQAFFKKTEPGQNFFSNAK